MDVDRLLNLEKRTGVKDTDIDAFLSKADAVQKAIRDMTEGKISPEDVHVEGIKSAKEEAAEKVCLLRLTCGRPSFFVLVAVLPLLYIYLRPLSNIYINVHTL